MHDFKKILKKIMVKLSYHPFSFIFFLFKKAPEDYTEAKYIWWALMAHLPLWIGWTSAAVVIENYFNVICGKPACLDQLSEGAKLVYN